MKPQRSIVGILGAIALGVALGDATMATARTGGCLPISASHGLGLSERTFRQENPSTGRHPTVPAYGVSYYEIEQTTHHGCVTSYAISRVTRRAQRPLSFLSRFGGANLPGDAQTVTANARCRVWKSRTLQKAFGDLYAVVRLEFPQQGFAPARATISLSSTARC